MKSSIFIFLCFCHFLSFSQKKVTIVMIIDDLTVRWDEEAIKLKTYHGVQNFCSIKEYQEETIDLLNTIHHWDTTLYFIVKNKFALNEDEEAAATIRDIETLEVEYTTKNFIDFVRQECTAVEEIDNNLSELTQKEYEKSVKKLEKELLKYVNSITNRIDIIDEHIHHLHFE